MVVAHGHQHAAVRRAARHVGVFEHVARAVHARPLAVPQAKDAVVFALAAQFGLLAAPQGGGGQIFVQAGLKGDVMFSQRFGGAHHLHVDRTQGRSAIAGDQPRRVQTSGAVTRFLHHHQPHQRLRAVQQDRVAVQVIAVIQ